MNERKTAPDGGPISNARISQITVKTVVVKLKNIPDSGEFQINERDFDSTLHIKVDKPVAKKSSIKRETEVFGTQGRNEILSMSGDAIRSLTEWEIDEAKNRKRYKAAKGDSSQEVRKL